MSPPGVAKKALLGDILVRKGLITPEQKEKALTANRESGRRLGEILIEWGVLGEEDIARVLAEQAGLPFFRLRKGLADPRVVGLVPREKAAMYEVLPLFRIHNRLTVAVGDPNKIFVLDVIRKLTECDVRPVVSLREDIIRMIEETYDVESGSMEDFADDMAEGELELVSIDSGREVEDIAQMAGESPIINLVNQIILKAMKDKASDIHIEPEQKFFRARFRIDGVLYEVMRQRSDLHAPVISRLKLMANLDIAERRLPQDGRIQVVAQGRTVDLRLSTLPGVYGEKIVLRVLDKHKGVLGMNELGFCPDTLCAFRSLLERPYGLVLVTGPTGSGKTTTLYAGLQELNSIEKNIVTIEDPVEYQFEIINQNQVKEEIGLTFARILKATLRQDPDVLMVGEIRDSETAKIAVQAALTGHLVLSTMHTNDAASSISRLLEIGVEPYLLAPSLVGVIGQRLVRTVCPSCETPYYASESEARAIGAPENKNLRLTRGRGCTECYDSGFRGRVGIYELLTSSEEFQDLLLAHPTLDQIRRYQAKKELPTLRSEGIRLVLEGRTTLEELNRRVFVD
ncbi:MAG: ATPase, T2SS/T4P/T4SS family [Candidatus Eisenbacteria bacterium]